MHRQRRPVLLQAKKNVLVKTKDDTMDEREYRVLGSQMKQSLVKTIRSNIKTLATLKKQGRKTGTVGFTSEVKSLGLPQPETTYAYADRRRGYRTSPAGSGCAASDNWRDGNRQRPFSPAKRTGGICMSPATWTRRNTASDVKPRD